LEETPVKRKLTIGYFFEDSFFPVANCMKNSVKEVIEFIKETHNVVEFKFPPMKEMLSSAYKILLPDQARNLK
jgi:hypothetical protein